MGNAVDWERQTPSYGRSVREIARLNMDVLYQHGEGQRIILIDAGTPFDSPLLFGACSLEKVRQNGQAGTSSASHFNVNLSSFALSVMSSFSAVV